ncbi:unnamed protein product [Owenia fusiformis]|uniref:Uncharacterized protein n=1 Tax=Owenia fusiformis TaxID=6347 RepID=A0A8J1U207_OWEFU|nr:unnamed protein product [Owenia fusiformis]
MITGTLICARCRVLKQVLEHNRLQLRTLSAVYQTQYDNQHYNEPKVMSLRNLNTICIKSGFNITAVMHSSCIFRCTPARMFHMGRILHRVHRDHGKETTELDQSNENLEDELSSSHLSELDDHYLLPENGHNVFIVQPDLKGKLRQRDGSNIELKLQEAIALVDSLPKWSVQATETVSIKESGKKEFFTKGNFAAISRQIRRTANITAVFVNTNKLEGLQLSLLQKAWGLPVYDRFTVVLQIFKDHARTKEAKLQVALAEIPYFRSRLKGMHAGTLDQQKGGLAHLGGSGETWIELRKRLLEERGIKIKRDLAVLKSKRHLLKKSRTKKEIPIVAVVGYTNAGKTSLIKVLTNEAALQPRDQLFATLDVTAHAGFLPSHLSVLYIDTVGFISDIPTSLIASFSATLEDIREADVIIHVRDISHPDTDGQKLNVIQTLESLELPKHLLDNMIEVCNKSDLNHSSHEGGGICTSAVTGQGIDDLKLTLEDTVITATGSMKKSFKVPMSGDHLRWLYKEATVVSTDQCDSAEHLLVHCIISQSAYGRFRAVFGKKKQEPS